MSNFSIWRMNREIMDARTEETSERGDVGVVPVRTTGRSDDRLPWLALVTMTLTTFVVVSAEMMPAAVLPDMADGLGVSLAQAGLLVSAWAATVVVASLPLARLTARLERPRVIAAALVVVALATVVTASADTYGTAMASRLVAAGATGLLWSLINAHAAAIVPQRHIARAAAIVLFGGTMGTVVAIPAGNAIAQVVGWRVPFLVLAVAALAAAVAVGVVLPRHRVHTAVVVTGIQRTAAPVRLWPVLATAGLGGLVLSAHFMVFTFVAEVLAPSAVPTPLLLVVFGAVGVGGLVLVGLTGDRYPTIVPVVVSLAMAAGVWGLVGLGRHAVLDVVLVAMWGVVLGGVGPAVQGRVMSMASSRHRATAGSLMPIAMNLGIALGAAAGSAAVDLWSPQTLPVLALVPLLAAATGFLLLARHARHGGLGATGARGGTRTHTPEGTGT
ncbi:MFS transporter [Pseudactinotalea sp. Z1739]|uniref:MFS transporter n=1 Tax=Pseudactinotalea sp. Z1739 TaxID=3413028 RepID=UPI003C7D06A0